MKKLNIVIIFSVLLCLLQSCMLVLPMKKVERDKKNDKVISHNSVMNTYITKKDVIRSFGSPTSKENLEGLEIWYYDKGTTTNSYSYGKANTNLSSNYSGINAKTNAYAGTSTSSYTRYVEFQFEDDVVISWRSKGVNYGKSSNWMPAWFAGFLIDSAIIIALAFQYGG